MHIYPPFSPCHDQAKDELCLKIDNYIRDRIDAAGEVIEGSESAVKRVIDRWTWVRDVKSSDPNWKLADTDFEN